MLRALAPTAFVAGLAAGILLHDLIAGPGDATITLVGLGSAAALSIVAGLIGPGPGRSVLAAAVLGAALATGVGIGAWRAASAGSEAAVGTVPSLIDGTEHKLSGTAIDDARPRGARQQIVLDELIADDAATGATRALSGRLLVWLPRGIALAAGDRVSLAARLEEPRDFDGFAYREYLARQGIGAIARAFSVEVVDGRGVVAVIGAARGALHRGLGSVVPEPEAALGSGILLGVRSGIAPEIDDAFATAGLTHIVAISGWNIAIVAALVAALTGPLAKRPAGRSLRIVITVASVGGYVLLTGASPSVVRAALMAGAILLARLGGSRAHAGSALVAACGLMLLAAPQVLWDVGFQLSLLATAGLICFGAAVDGRLAPLPAWLREPVALTLAAQITTLPVILLNFERLSIVAPVANVIVVPLVPLAMLACAVAAVVGMLDAAVAAPLVGDAARWAAGGTAWLALRAMIEAGTGLAGVPGAALDVAVPAPLVAAWYPILGLAWWSLRTGDRRPDEAPLEEIVLRVAGRPSAPREAAGGALAAAAWLARPRRLAAVVLLVLGIVTVAGQPDGRLHLSVLDIGQGDAILVEAPSGATLLIDGGPDPELALRRLGQALPFFERRIDVLLLSHPHQDHVAGLVAVLERFEVGLVLHAGIGYENAAYDRLLADAARERGGRAELARAGQVVTLDATTTIEILYPTEGDAAAPLPDGDINNGSVVAILRNGSFSALLTGDAEAPVETALVARGLIPDVDVLKVGHHGSNSSTTPALLDAAVPELALISSGADNDYGHPSPETLASLAARDGLTVMRTDLHGTIEVISDGVSYEVRSARPP